MRPAVRSGRCSPRTGWRRGRRTLVGASSSSPPAADHVFDTLGATWWIDAAQEVTDGATSACQWALNRGNQAVPHARLGSSGRAELRGSYGLVLPGVNGNYATTPDANALDATSELEMVVRVAADDWTPSAIQILLSKRPGGQAGYSMALDTTGKLYCSLSDGATTVDYLSTAATSFTDGQAGWLKVTFSNSLNEIKFYTAADASSEPGSWSQLGATTSATQDLAAGTGVLAVGGVSGSGQNPFAGKFYRAIVRSGIGGTTVFDADFTTATAFATSFTESSANAATVTINATSGADTNDPLLLPHTGTNYLYLPGITGNYASATDLAAVRPTGDMEFVTRVSLADWTPSAIQPIYISGSPSGFPTINHYLYVNTSGNLVFLRPSGSTDRTYTSTAVAPFTDGATGWIKVTFDQTNGSTSEVKFYTAADQATEPSSWTQLGSAVTNANVGAGNSDVTGLRVGTNVVAAGLVMTGSVYRTVIRDGIAGTTVFDANFTANTNQSSFTESSANAATVTINRATSGRKSVMVTRPVWLFGTDDYMEVADNDLLDVGAGESLSAVIIMREFATGSGNTCFLSKYQGSFDEGWGLIRISAAPYQTRTYLESGASNVEVGAPSAYSVGVATLSGAHIDRTAQTVRTSVGNSLSGTASIAALGSIANTGQFRIGRNANAGDFLNGEVMAVAVFKGATLNSTQLGEIATYFGV